MYSLGTTIGSLRRRLEALKRKYAREIAAAVLKPVAQKIVNLWDIATAKKQPKPNPVDCVRKVADAGFRLKTLNALHGYIDSCERYGGFPDADEIVNKLLPPKQPVELSAVLPARFPVR